MRPAPLSAGVILRLPGRAAPTVIGGLARVLPAVGVVTTDPAAEPGSVGFPPRVGCRTTRNGPAVFARSSGRHGGPGIPSWSELASGPWTVAHYPPVQRPLRIPLAIVLALPATLALLVGAIRIGRRVLVPRPVGRLRWRPVAWSGAVAFRSSVPPSPIGRIWRPRVTTSRITAVPGWEAARPTMPVHRTVALRSDEAAGRPEARAGVIAAGRPDAGTGPVTITLAVPGTRRRVAATPWRPGSVSSSVAAGQS